MLTIIDLRCEYAPNPLGIDVRVPRFSWALQSAERDQAQSAYQILVASSLETLAADIGDLWDSGKMPTNSFALIEYAGTPLVSRQRAYWKVRVWDRADQVYAYSDVAWFEMGLLDPADWIAAWIGFPSGWNGKALHFRDRFVVTQPVISARAYVASPNWYELHLNGHKIGDRVLEPAQTDAGKRVLYTSYDVTEALHLDANVIGVLVGSGWYGTPKLLVQLELCLADGSLQRVISGKWLAGGSWWRVADGPIISTSIYDGETYDARLERPGWDTPETFGDDFPNRDQWAGSMATEPPGGKLVAAALEPCRVIETRRAIALTQPTPGVYVFDSGQNLAGWAQITVQGKRGTVITLQFAEVLYDDGTVNTKNLRSARARDTYILKGDDVEVWEPRFTYHGFRYVQIEGFPSIPTLDTLAIRVVRSDVAPAGMFECDHPLINRIHQAVWWTEASNLHGVPTDCPQRDERMGWLNDMAARTEEAIYNFDLARLLRKWVDDIADTQDAQGAISDTAPFRWGSRPGDPVEVAYLLIPMLLYQHYGDLRVLEEHYAGMRHWVDFLTSRAEGHILSYGWIGDWAPPITESIVGSAGSSAQARNTPTPVVSTAFYGYAVALLQQIASKLRHVDDAQEYHTLWLRIVEAFNHEFWDEALGVYGTGNQACNTLALYMNLAPPERQDRVIKALVQDIEAHGYHLTTGNLCTKFIFEVLTRFGHGNIAFRLATQTTYPSWGYMLEQGATTIWERWEKATGRGMNSHNHPMYGSIGAWFYRALAGIELGTGLIVLRPLIPNGLNRVSAAIRTVRGEVACTWERDDDTLRFHIRLPVGSEADFAIPRLKGVHWRVHEGDQVIWAASAAAGHVPGVLEMSESDTFVWLLLRSGEYHFTATAEG